METALAAESLLSLAVNVTSEQRVESVLRSIVQGLASQPGVALARIWLLPSADLPSCYHVESDPPDCLLLVASAGTPISSPGEDWCFLQGHFASVPFNVGKVGQMAASRQPILVEDVAAQNEWVVRPEWARREEIRSFAGHPLIFRDKLLGVIAVFSRQQLGQQEFTWLGLFANQTALAIANACAEEALQSREHNLAIIINTIPTAAWTTRPDGYCDFLNQVWLNYAGMSAEQAQGWAWAQAIHADDRKRLVEEWRSCLDSGTPVDTEARIRRFDGSYRWFLIRANPLRNETGHILKWYGTCIDIEDHKRVEGDLRSKELSWRQIVDNIPGLVATMGASGEVEFLNRQTLEYFGKTNEELKNWSLMGAVHPDDLPRVIEARVKAIETGQIYEVEHRCRRADGAYRWFQVRGIPVRDAEGTIITWYLLLTDVDDRKKAEEALCARELDARSLLDNVPGFLGRHSPDGTPEIVNRPFLQYQGKTVEEIGRWRTSDVVHPEDLARVIEGFGNGISSGQPWGLEFRLRRSDGIYRWFEARWVPVRDVDGRILHWNALTTDIDDRKKAQDALLANERNLESIINTIPAHIYVLDTEGSVKYVNRAVMDYTGLTLEDVQQDDYRDRVIHPEDFKRVRAVRAASLKGAAQFSTEQRVLGKDGQFRWFLVRYQPVLEEQGRIVRWYVAASDIEDRKRAENVRLEERTRIARELHDTLLQSFQAALLKFHGVTCQLSDRPELQKTLEGVVDQARQAVVEGRDAVQGLRSSTVLTNDLVRAIRILCAELADQTDKQAPVYQVNVKGTPRDLAPILQDDIYRIAGEAVRNAFQHAQAGSIEVQIQYDQRRLRLRVRDDGKGIDPKVLESGARAGHYGLPGLQERAKLLSGKLRILSDPGSGTEIDLTIPASVIYAPASGRHAISRGRRAS